MLAELVMKNRSYRRFDETVKISRETLKELVGLARLTASGGNLQPIKYILSCEPEMNKSVFECLAWAAYLKDWKGPAEGERPTAYIIIVADTRISETVGCDHGIAAQTMLLGAAEKGLGGCMIGSVNREKLRKLLAIPPQYGILLVVALGKPAEQVKIETVGPNGDTKYWRDPQGVHHVPKRSLDELILA